MFLLKMMQLHILKWENKTKSVGLKKYLNTPGNFAERGVFNVFFFFFLRLLEPFSTNLPILLKNQITN